MSLLVQQQNIPAITRNNLGLRKHPHPREIAEPIQNPGPHCSVDTTVPRLAKRRRSAPIASADKAAIPAKLVSAFQRAIAALGCDEGGQQRKRQTPRGRRSSLGHAHTPQTTTGRRRVPPLAKGNASARKPAYNGCDVFDPFGKRSSRQPSARYSPQSSSVLILSSRPQPASAVL